MLSVSSLLVAALLGSGMGSEGAVQNQAAAGTDKGQRLEKPAAPPEAKLITDRVTFAPVISFEKGQSRRYGTQSSMVLRFFGQNDNQSNSASSTSMNVTLRYKVRDTKPDGSAQVSVVSEGGRMLDATGAFQTLVKEQETAARTLSLDRQSHIVAFKDQTLHKASGGLDALFNQSNLLVPLQILPLPDKTIHVGESWTALYAAPGKSLSANEISAISKENAKGNLKESSEDDVNSDVKATLTLLGIEKIGDVDTIKIRQVLTVTYITYTDAQGKSTDARNAKGRMRMLLTFTQLVNALPQNGLMVRSIGSLVGNVVFEGTLAGQVPGSKMTISGKIVAVRLEDEPAIAPSK